MGPQERLSLPREEWYRKLGQETHGWGWDLMALAGHRCLKSYDGRNLICLKTPHYGMDRSGWAQPLGGGHQTSRTPQSCDLTTCAHPHFCTCGLGYPWWLCLRNRAPYPEKPMIPLLPESQTNSFHTEASSIKEQMLPTRPLCSALPISSDTSWRRNSLSGTQRILGAELRKEAPRGLPDGRNEWVIINEWKTRWTNECVPKWKEMTEWRSEWVNAWMKEWRNNQKNEWTIKWMKRWMSEWMEKWMVECMRRGMNKYTSKQVSE